MPQIQILMGRIDYLSHTVNENLLSTKIDKIDALYSLIFKINHLKNDGHEIEVIVNQGFGLKKPSTEIILTIESCSKFKVIPYTDGIFKKPASIEMIKLFTEISKLAIAHNSGMFCIIREDYGLEEWNPRPISADVLKSLIFNDTNKLFLN